MWFHKWRYAEIRKSHPQGDNPMLKGKAFPIVELEIIDEGHKVKAAKLLIQEQPRIALWFHWSEITLYAGPKIFSELGTDFDPHSAFSKRLINP